MASQATNTTTVYSLLSSTISLPRDSAPQRSLATAFDTFLCSPRPQLPDRNASPSRASVVSTSSNLTTSTVPQLKRKHGNRHIRRQQQLQSTQCLVPTPTTNGTRPLVQSQEGSRPSVPVGQAPQHSVLPALPSTPSVGQRKVTLSRSNTAPSPRRAPASHSSYGVETTAGPPPSFETQRTLSTERVWQFDKTKLLRMTTTADRGLETLLSASLTPQLVQSSPDTADTQSIPTPTDAEEVIVMEAPIEETPGVSQSEAGSKASTESHKSEDLFLNIAQIEPPRLIEKRKPRMSLPFLSSSRPPTSHRARPSNVNSDTASVAARSEVPSYSKRRSLDQHETISLSRTYFSQPQISSALSERDRPPGRRTSMFHADTLQLGRLGTARNNKLASESANIDKVKLAEPNKTESTVSTAAPSTVWDELDDLKSRIRKLEITGKLPLSSAAAMSTADRPRTATTAATTMSGSPKHNKMPATLPSAIEGVPSDVHPLLHEAMTNVKAVVSHDVYQKLQLTAQDALTIAQMVSLDPEAAGLSQGAYNTADRQLSRKAESMCRSLTELAIALSAEAKATAPTLRPVSRDMATSQSPDLGPRSRRYSNTNEPSDRSSIRMRVQSRLDSRRASSNYARPSPDLESPTALPYYPGSGSKIPPRPSATYRTRASNAYLDGTSNDDEEVLDVRPLSRAMTDVTRLRRVSRDSPGRPREYTSQHPLPISLKPNALHHEVTTQRTPLPPQISTNFISRRKYPSPSLVSTPTGQQNPDSSPLGGGTWTARLAGRRRP